MTIANHLNVRTDCAPTKEKAAQLATGTASNTTLEEHSTSPERQKKDPLIGWYNLASPTLKREAKRQKRGCK